MKLGLALSGGGVRGMAHIGALRALVESGIRIDALAGTSAGALVGGLFAAGYIPDELEEIALSIDQSLVPYSVLSIVSDVVYAGLSRKKRLEGLISNKKLYKLLHKHLGDLRIGQVSIPLAVPTVDIQSGQTVIFVSEQKNLRDSATIVCETDCFLAQAVLASAAIPAVFPPVIIDGRKLVDGGVSDNIPVAVLQAMEMDVVVAVDLGGAAMEPQKVDSIFEIAWRAQEIQGCTLGDTQRALADVLIQPDVSGVKLFDFFQTQALIQQGYEATMGKIKLLKSMQGVR